VARYALDPWDRVRGPGVAPISLSLVTSTPWRGLALRLPAPPGSLSGAGDVVASAPRPKRRAYRPDRLGNGPVSDDSEWRRSMGSKTASMTQSVEREMKFEVPEQFQLPALDEVGDASTVTLVATYWDTRDRKLLRWGHTLRFRHASDGSEDGWTLKLRPPSRAGSRKHTDVMDRIEVQADSRATFPPDGLRNLVVGIVRRDPLVPIARLETTRRATVVGVREPGEPWLELSDDAVSSMVDGEPGPTFREIEVEARGSDGRSSDSPFGNVVDRLIDVGATPTSTTKIQKVLDAGAGPEVHVVPLERKSSVGELVRFAFATGVVRLLEHDPLVRSGSDPEAVHQARVATRRLRSNLKTLEPLLSRAPLDRLRDDLAWIGGLLGAVRDLDVLIDRVERASGRLPRAQRDETASIAAALRDDRRIRHLELVEGMESVRYVNLLIALVEASESPPLAGPSSRRAKPVYRALARKAWRRTSRAVARLDEQASDAELHEVRKRAKRSRYAAELGRGMFGKPSRRFAKRLEAVQDDLGELQDAVTAEEYLGSLAARRLSGSAAYVAGAIVCEAREVRSSGHRRWRSVWNAADRKRLRRWFR
jgi:CHAD domain-containing protein